MKIKASVNLWEESYGKPYRVENETSQERCAAVEELVFGPVEIKNTENRPGSFIFIDGVMRKDANLFFEINDENLEASLYTLAAGAVLMKSGQINLLPENLLNYQVQRILMVSKPFFIPILENFWQEKMRELPVDFVPNTCGKESENGVAVNLMRELEGLTAKRIEKNILPDTLLITDGNLHYPSYPCPVIGFVKTISRAYPDEVLFNKNKILAPQTTRSSVFEIRGNNVRLSWYIALSKNPQVSWIYNLARLEVFAELGLEKTAEIADWTALCLPEFILPHASRYPQNLAPVEALEKELRSYMGNTQLIKNLLLEGLS